MPYFETSQEWLEQSALLVEARPETTRITTRYSIKTPRPRSGATDTDDTSSPAAPAADPKPPRASLVVKTYDPVSGVVLKYRTTKAAEVSRLIYASLGQLGRGMAAVPDLPELSDEPMPDAPPAAETSAATTAAASGGGTGTPQAQPQQAAGGGKKKKKGKK
ncbi:hypothetical protein S40285_00390 [Stachybotrys chlorohalonatus IBT 40285]|uniref:SRP9 domain-containing protein n=1 Tax=Stachybotrys chlorohalonatus (strain IBT 40285) TaxID=1283841 RepID=A0A084QHN8_STAC4|nr:hypothetical protein S40285_00390 [Stachybotrys chlorohalonata IBT 40285]